MITPVGMHDAICDFLEKGIAARYELKSTDSNGNDFFRNPRVVRTGWILPRSADEFSLIDESLYDNEDERDAMEAAIEDEYPFILPRISKVENIKDTRESIVTLEILYGVYGPALFDENGKRINDGTGYRDLWNLIESTRQALFTQYTIDKRYRIVEDFFEADMIDEQIYPYWEGRCTTKWYVMFPLPKIDERFF